MAQRPILLTSDAHLGAAPPEGERAFLTWLAWTPSVASRVVINGDLFDFWFEYRRGIPKGHDGALRLLREVVDSGTPVTLMGGNHDWWGGKYLREVVGVEFLQDPVVRTFAGRRTLLAHGDGLGRGDLGYRALRLVLRGRATRFAFSLLGPRWGGVAGRAVSRTHGHWGDPTPQEMRRSQALEAWALGALEADPGLDLVALGHTHIPKLVEASPGRWYLNSGDWLRSRSYAVLSEGEPPRLLTWGG